MQLLQAIALLAAATTATAASCPCTAKTPPFTPGELSADQFTPTTNRRYRVHLPKSYQQSTKTPVIFSYHGAGGTIEKQVKLDGFTDLFRNDRYIVVYLQAATPNGTDKAQWQVAPEARDIDDLGFTSDVLQILGDKVCLDKRRVYAAGKSQGGGFVGQKLACDKGLSKKFAAFAPVSGAYYILDQTKKTCEPTADVPIPCDTERTDTPILAFHGGADPTIPYRGIYRSGTRSCLPDIRHWVREWAFRDGLKGTQDNSTIQGSQNGVKSAWKDERVTLFYDGDNIPHDWPSLVENSDNAGGPTAAFNASDIILPWFERWSLPLCLST
ncbi:hypothetical protein MCOR03_008377 [Pyricularia oryzae]|nr:hypothetical protein MCOR01_000429 [Pyricularia oryzae]KAI6313282.1 hypothetical protein MCOR30_010316 [Pyricularia oryzae]KAI6357208.1 hypothetical protein MCOR31_010432 [Pyricularia oryzae]KAI6552454.1 hypothetical protein MCOR03_008377 [Pyricularia oryzae]